MPGRILRFPHLIIAIALFLITLSVNLAMPLFRVYAAAAHLNNGQTALVFASYILGMLPCYIFLGGISDKLGRKPIVIASVCSGFIATAIITAWPNVTALIFARFFQGVAVGLGMGAGTAYISELLQHHPKAASKAAGLASLFTAFGFGGGALITGIALLVHFTVTPVTYYLVLVITFIGLVLLFLLPRHKAAGGRLIRLPYFPPRSLPINIAIAICWAATGIIIAIIPPQLAKFNLIPYAGFCVVLVNWTGACIQPFIRKHDPLKLVTIGLWVVPLGFALVIIGCSMGWLPLILCGASIVGSAAYGFSYLGGLGLITNLAGHQKARAVSGYMFFGYVGFGIPAVTLGYFADRFGITNALWLFEIVIVLCSIWLFTVFARPAYTVKL